MWLHSATDVAVVSTEAAIDVVSMCGYTGDISATSIVIDIVWC